MAASASTVGPSAEPDGTSWLISGAEASWDVLPVASALTTLPPRPAYHPDRELPVRACLEGEGLDASGALRWSGGEARHLYVVDPDRALGTGLLDLALPAGTLWRVDAALFGAPLRGAVRYGEVPEGARQVWPVQTPAPLVAGTTYLLVVLADVGHPLTSCTFEVE